MSALRPVRPAPAATRPSTEVGTGPTVPGLLFRAVLFGVTVAFATLTAHSLLPSLAGSVVIGLALATVITRFPRPPVPHAIVLAGGAALLGASTTFDPVVFVLLPLVHLMLRASWWAARVPRTGAVERSVLVLDLRRAAAIQTACQGLALVALAASGIEGEGFLTVVAALALCALAVLVVPRTWWRRG